MQNFVSNKSAVGVKFTLAVGDRTRRYVKCINLQSECSMTITCTCKYAEQTKYHYKNVFKVNQTQIIGNAKIQVAYFECRLRKTAYKFI